jgi:hypothetical protein
VGALAGNRHPEFGYLCPARLRRKLRRMAAVAAFALVAGASSTAVRVSHQGNALALALQDGMSAPVSATSTHAPVGPAASEAKSRATQTTVAACREARNVDGACGSGKTRKLRVVRIPLERPVMAASPIGRVEGALLPAEPVTPQIAETSADTTKPADDMSQGPASAEAAPASKPKTAPAVSINKAPRMANHNQARRRSVYASSPSYDSQYRGSRFYNPWLRTVFW